MELEKDMVIQYINDKRESEILIDTAEFWKRAEAESARREDQDRRLEISRLNTCPNGWTTLWTRMEEEA